MECEKVRHRFSSLWERELSSFEEKILEEHLSSCLECRREFEQFEKTMRWLRSAGEVEVPEGFLPELYKKREERKGAILGEKPGRRWFHFPLFFKLPAQAVAMVAIVFLVLYLTKIMPMEGGRLMERKQTSSPLPEKSEQVLTPSAAPNPIAEGEVGKRRSGSTVSEPWPLGRGVEGLPRNEGERRALETSKETPHPMDSDQAKAPVPEEKKGEETYAPEIPPPKAGLMAYQRMESKGAGKEGSPSPEPGKIKRELAVREKSLIASKPPQEIILKISDRERVIPRLHELVKQFGGEVVATEGYMVLASLPTESFSEFEKALAGFRSSAKADRLIVKKDAEGTLRKKLEEGVKREEGDVKSKGSASPAADTGNRMIVHILLVEE